MLMTERADLATASMTVFASRLLPTEPTVTAPDGSAVRVLLGLASGSMAHFALAPGQVAKAVEHRSVEEIWYVLAGGGQMWRSQDSREDVVTLEPGLCLTIPLGTRFQFRAAADTPLSVVAITMPPWPGEDEAVLVEGPWEPTA
jgi:mannose-6-phosphate isomerase-like protein (cupin superfamily)